MTPAAVLKSLHKQCLHNRTLLAGKERAGCFHCCTTFSPATITEWVDAESDTALCPQCGIDAVLPDAVAAPLTPALLSDMHKHWFETTVTIPTGWRQTLTRKQGWIALFVIGWVATVAMMAISDYSTVHRLPTWTEALSYVVVGCLVGPLFAWVAASKAGIFKKGNENP